LYQVVEQGFYAGYNSLRFSYQVGGGGFSGHGLILVVRLSVLRR